MESHLNASKYYLEAMAYMKQKPGYDVEALETMNLLSETHRRKAKLLGIRDEYGVAHVKKKIKGMMKEQQILKRAQQKGGELAANLNEKERQEFLEREEYMKKMKEELLIINSQIFGEAKKQLEVLIEYQKTKLEKFEARFLEILNIFKKAFNDQTKELIISHGEKFVSVQTNPFVKEALKESLNISKIEKQTQKMEQLMGVLKKFRNMMDERLTKVVV